MIDTAPNDGRIGEIDDYKNFPVDGIIIIQLSKITNLIRVISHGNTLHNEIVSSFYEKAK